MNKSSHAALFLIALASCTDMRYGAEQIAECEKGYIHSLKSPSSYKMVASEAFVTTDSVDKVSQDFNIADNSLATNENGMASLMYVRIEYDADNSFGASIRNEEFCHFTKNASGKWQQVFRDYSVEIERLEAGAIDGVKKGYEK